MKNNGGFAQIETLVALAILGIVAVTYLCGLTTVGEATVVISEQVIAESLVRSQVEYVKDCDYQYSATQYPVDPVLNVPEGWSVPPPVVGLVHETDDGIQSVTVNAEHDGTTILSVEIFKVSR